ncbi:MAG: hypothetical protein QOJ98_3177 [Acidobacteriota bacterium]|jgi:hypothetical protein|nr:hypothetical protein [Acidobacteriota bacterium]
MTMRKLLLVFFIFSAASAASAAESGTLSLSPAVVMLRGEHGQSTTQTLTLINGTTHPFSFDLVAQDVTVRDGKRVFAEAGTLPGSIAATAVFSQKEVHVAPGERVVVTMTVTLPPATEQRAIVALFRGTNRVMSGHVPMTASLGALLTFATSDNATLTTAELKLRPQSASENLAVSHACTNSGREPLVAKGVLAILDASGSLIGRSALQPYRLLPGESAELGGEYAGELDPGKYRVLVTYDYEGKTLTKSAEVTVE